MTDFNQRKQRVDNQYNAENINVYQNEPSSKPTEGEKSSTIQKTYPVNCVGCSRVLEIACPRPNHTPKRIGINETRILPLLSFFLGTVSVDDTDITCPHCKKAFFVNWYY